jgi:hypothetical protein
MKNRKNKLTLVLVCLFFSLIGSKTQAQISEGGKPVSFSLGGAIQEIHTLIMPPVNVDSVIQAEAKLGNTPRPFQFGYAIDVDIDLKKLGTLKHLSDGGKLWLLKIHSKDAFSINLIYDRFTLSKGSRFFVYNEDRTMVLGAFTPEVSNNSYNEFATDLIQGNTIVLEYYEPNGSDGGIINVSKVIHGYINTFSSGLGLSGACNIDVNCPLGNNWIYEKRAVSLILVNNGTAHCSGSLINNTAQDGKPYYLTANHCANTNGPQPSTWIFRFKYWRPNCGSGNPDPNLWKSILGANIRARHVNTDFLLLELFTTPPVDFNLYYAGWDRTSIPAQVATGIHHPSGDAMKISYAANPATFFAWNPALGLTHWRVNFNEGTAEHGSSGSPLFNQARRVVGQLHGNSAYNRLLPYCEQRQIEYGRFDLSWTGGGTNDTRLSNWLHPFNTPAPNILNGMVPCIETTISNRTINQNETIECNKINVTNTTIMPNRKLTLEANTVNINSNFTIEPGGQFEIKLLSP